MRNARFEENVGREVMFNIIIKDSKGNDKFIKNTGKILFSNRTGTGYVILGKSVSGQYNRNKSEITYIEKEPKAPSVQIIECIDNRMTVVA